MGRGYPGARGASSEAGSSRGSPGWGAARGNHPGVPSEAEALELLGIALPVLGDLDVQVEVDLLPQQGLDAAPRLGPDLLEPGATTADDDRLLARPLDEQVDPDLEHRVVRRP